MPTLRQATQVVNNEPVPSADGNEPIAIVGDFTVPTGLVINDVIEMCALPANYVPLDVTLDCADMDSNGSPAVVLNAGIISGSYGVADNARTCGAEFISASTVGQAGGIARMAVAGGTKIAPTTADRGVGLKVATAAATLTVGALIRFTLFCQPARNGV